MESPALDSPRETLKERAARLLALSKELREAATLIIAEMERAKSGSGERIEEQTEPMQGG